MRILCNTEVQNDNRYIRLRTNTALQNAWYWYEWVQCLVMTGDLLGKLHCSPCTECLQPTQQAPTQQASLAAYSTMR